MQKTKLKNTQQFVNIKAVFAFFFILTIIFTSCDKNEDIQEIPSYITITDVTLNATTIQGSNIHNITDVWLYVNDQNRGTYPLPAHIPILEKDSATIKIFAGIMDNGISATRLPYSFYKMYEENIFLVPDSSVNISPVFKYKTGATIEVENFEGVGTDIDTTLKSQIDFQIKTEGANHFAEAILENDNKTFEVATKDFINLPQVASPVYMELEYKSSHQFTIGAYVNYPFAVSQHPLVHVTAKEEWNKIYINMTSTVSSAINNSSIKFYINMNRADTTEQSWIKFDNLKIIY